MIVFAAFKNYCILHGHIFVMLTVFVFQAQLVDASGQRVTQQDLQDFKWFVRAELKYNSFNSPEQTSTKTFEGSVSSNPVEIVLPSGTSTGRDAYYSEISV